MKKLTSKMIHLEFHAQYAQSNLWLTKSNRMYFDFTKSTLMNGNNQTQTTKSIRQFEAVFLLKHSAFFFERC